MADKHELLQAALEHHQSGRLSQAEALYRRVLALEPQQVDALYLLGCLQRQSGKYAEALELLQKAARLQPDQAEYQYALGLAQSALGEHRDAEASYRRAVETAPDHAGALVALGRMIRLSNRKSREAAEYLLRAVRLTPDDVELECELAEAWLDAGEPRLASSIYGQVVYRRPELARGWFGKGCAANELEEFIEARNCFAKALELAPEWLEARHNLARALEELGHVSEAFAYFSQCAEMEQAGSEQSLAMMAVIVPGVPGVSNERVLEVRRGWAERLPNEGNRDRKRARRREGVTRVGYVSSFFHRDNWMKPVWGLINRHDRAAVQVNLFSDCAASKIQHGYKRHSEDRYFDTSELSNGELADLVEKCEIDVLVDLNGYSNMRRLPMFAGRMAPVMIGWFNMYATTGMSSFDYLIGDPAVIPVEEERFYSEEILRVSGSYLTFDVSYPVPPVAARNAGEMFVYGALGSQYKMTYAVIEAWCRILQAVPASLLLVKNKQIRSGEAAKYLVSRFKKHGIEAARLLLEGPEAHFDFLSAYNRIDLALDTFPYNGGTTTTEAIWQGVPVVTFYGDRWVSRTSASILRAGGLGEFVASDLDGYVELAIELGLGGVERLRELRLQMRDRLSRSAVCDTLGFARQMEMIYAQCRLRSEGGEFLV